MSRGQHAVILACVLLLSGAAPACELVLSEHRSGRELARLPLDPAVPAFRVAFTHSVLGTPVEDHYRFRRVEDDWRAYLVEERWSGEGYGLPIAAGPGESLVRDRDGWRLSLNRLVHPLVIRPLPTQHMRVLLGGRSALRLGTLSERAIAFDIDRCPVS